MSEEVRISVEEEDNDAHIWRSCCLKLDKHFVLFFAQFFISMSVMTLSAYQLVHLENCEAQALYSGIILMIAGSWLPSPKITKR